ncbi:hypothetical protein IW262DRAFT_1460664 [Armillaria fumosa]|nr:hypothetical protein IW262DRAFT_1460664 [Armillaria fumosa]
MDTVWSLSSANVMTSASLALLASITVTFILTEPDVAAWREDAGITTFLRNMVSSPSAPTITRLCIDFPDQIPAVFSLATDNHGTPPLLNQLFTPLGETSCMEPFLAGVEVYPLRLRLDNVHSLDLRMSIRVTCTFPRIVGTLGKTLKRLHLYYTPSTLVCDLYPFMLDGFPILRHMEVSVSFNDLVYVLRMLCTWTFPVHGAVTSKLCLNVLMGGRLRQDVTLPPLCDAISAVLLSHTDDEYRPFNGAFKVTLVYSELGSHIECGVDTFEALMESVRSCEDVVATIS